MAKAEEAERAFDPFERVLGLLTNITRRTDSDAMARCPCHDDRTASLHITRGEDGRALLKCHASSGCPTEQIVAAIGLTMADLFPANGNGHNRQARSNVVRIVATYDYRDAEGALIYQVVRCQPKTFRQRRPDGKGGWIWDLKGVTPLPYRLRELLSADPTEWVCIPEGEKDVDNLIGLGFIATCNSGGAGKFKSELANHFQNRRIAVLPDNDDPGRKHARALASILAPVAAEVTLIELPNLPAKGDVSDWIKAGGTREQLLKLIEAARATPIIVESGDQHQAVAAAAFKALERCNSDPVRLVRHAGGLRRIECGEDGQHQVVDLDLHRLRDELTMVALWLDRKGRASVPSADFGRLMLAKAEPPLPAVTRFARCPVFTSDGRLLHQPGWDSRSGIYLLPPKIALGDVPESPTNDDVMAAVDLLLEMLVDFPFATASDRTNALALPLERLVREMIDGPLPLHMIDASVRGAGKGLLANALLSAIGQSPAVWAEVEDGAEMRKALTSYFAAGQEVILIDNLRGALNSGVLAAAITALEWRDRLLGTNRDLCVKIRNSWVITGNNVVVSSELLRRSSRIRLVPDTERPEERATFKHPELLGWARDNRSRLMRALIVLVRNWIAKSRPVWSGRPIGSFESWSRVIGGILEISGFSDFQANRADMHDAADFETAPWRELIARWWEASGDKPQGIAELFPLAQQADSFPLYGKTDRAQRTAFGKQLAKWKDRVVVIATADGREIEIQIVALGQKVRRAAQWRLRQLRTAQ